MGRAPVVLESLLNTAVVPSPQHLLPPPTQTHTPSSLALPYLGRKRERNIEENQLPFPHFGLVLEAGERNKGRLGWVWEAL